MTAKGRVLHDIALESGEVLLDNHPSESDTQNTIMELVGSGSEVSLSDRMDAIDQGNALAQDLDGIVATVQTDGLSVEAMEFLYDSAKRQYKTLMLAHGLSLSVSSLESFDGHGAMHELSKMSSSLRRASAEQLDYSAEGFMEWLRRDAAKLEAAYDVLEKASRNLSRKLTGPAAEKPIVFTSISLETFFKKGLSQITDLERAIKDESADLHRLHAAVESAFKSIGENAKRLLADPESATVVAGNKWAREVNAAKTGRGALMGNHSIRAAEPGGDPTMVDKLVRMNETKSSRWNNIKKSLSDGSPEAATIVLGTASIIATYMLNPAFAAFYAPRAGAMIGAAAGKMVIDSAMSGNKILRKPLPVSTASFKEAVDTVNKTYNRFTRYESDVDHIHQDLKDALKHGKEAKIDPEDYKILEEVCKKHRESLIRLGVIAEAICTQATYTVMQLSVVATSALGKLK